MHGCVVVGIGMAGQARIRDLLTPLASSAAEIFTLKGLVSRSVSFHQTIHPAQNGGISRGDITIKSHHVKIH